MTKENKQGALFDTRGARAAKTRGLRAAAFYEGRAALIKEHLAAGTLHTIALATKEAAPFFGLTPNGVTYRARLPSNRWRMVKNEVGHESYFIPAKEWRRLAKERQAEAAAAVVVPLLASSTGSPLTEARVLELIDAKARELIEKLTPEIVNRIFS